MNDELIKSQWGVFLDTPIIDNNSNTLCIILPGVAYLLDRSYLDYSKQLACELEYDVLAMEYGFHKTRSKFDIEKEFHPMASETIKAINMAIKKDYKHYVIIGKSIGTCVQIMLNRQLENKNITNIYISPIDKTAKHGIEPNSLVITGTADPLLKLESLDKLRATEGVKLVTIEGANHSLDIPGNVFKTIDILKEVLKTEKQFLSEKDKE